MAPSSGMDPQTYVYKLKKLSLSKVGKLEITFREDVHLIGTDNYEQVETSLAAVEDVIFRTMDPSLFVFMGAKTICESLRNAGVPCYWYRIGTANNADPNVLPKVSVCAYDLVGNGFEEVGEMSDELPTADVMVERLQNLTDSSLAEAWKSVLISEYTAGVLSTATVGRKDPMAHKNEWDHFTTALRDSVYHSLHTHGFTRLGDALIYTEGHGDGAKRQKTTSGASKTSTGTGPLLQLIVNDMKGPLQDELDNIEIDTVVNYPGLSFDWYRNGENGLVCRVELHRNYVSPLSSLDESDTAELLEQPSLRRVLLAPYGTVGTLVIPSANLSAHLAKGNEYLSFVHWNGIVDGTSEFAEMCWVGLDGQIIAYPKNLVFAIGQVPAGKNDSMKQMRRRWRKLAAQRQAAFKAFNKDVKEESIDSIVMPGDQTKVGELQKELTEELSALLKVEVPIAETPINDPGSADVQQSMQASTPAFSMVKTPGSAVFNMLQRTHTGGITKYSPDAGISRPNARSNEFQGALPSSRFSTGDYLTCGDFGLFQSSDSYAREDIVHGRPPTTEQGQPASVEGEVINILSPLNMTNTTQMSQTSQGDAGHEFNPWSVNPLVSSASPSPVNDWNVPQYAPGRSEYTRESTRLQDLLLTNRQQNAQEIPLSAGGPGKIDYNLNSSSEHNVSEKPMTATAKAQLKLRRVLALINVLGMTLLSAYIAGLRVALSDEPVKQLLKGFVKHKPALPVIASNEESEKKESEEAEKIAQPTTPAAKAGMQRIPGILTRWQLRSGPSLEAIGSLWCFHTVAAQHNADISGVGQSVEETVRDGMQRQYHFCSALKSSSLERPLRLWQHFHRNLDLVDQVKGSTADPVPTAPRAVRTMPRHPRSLRRLFVGQWRQEAKIPSAAWPYLDNEIVRILGSLSKKALEPEKAAMRLLASSKCQSNPPNGTDNKMDVDDVKEEAPAANGKDSEDMEPSYSEPLRIPHLLMKHEGDRVATLPNALSQWQYLGLQPYSGGKNISYLIVAPESVRDTSMLTALVSQIASAYNALNLGDQEPLLTQKAYDRAFATPVGGGASGTLSSRGAGAAGSDNYTIITPGGASSTPGGVAQLRRGAQSPAVAALRNEASGNVITNALMPNITGVNMHQFRILAHDMDARNKPTTKTAALRMIKNPKHKDDHPATGSSGGTAGASGERRTGASPATTTPAASALHGQYHPAIISHLDAILATIFRDEKVAATLVDRPAGTPGTPGTPAALLTPAIATPGTPSSVPMAEAKTETGLSSHALADTSESGVEHLVLYFFVRGLHRDEEGTDSSGRGIAMSGPQAQQSTSGKEGSSAASPQQRAAFEGTFQMARAAIAASLAEIPYLARARIMVQFIDIALCENPGLEGFDSFADLGRHYAMNVYSRCRVIVAPEIPKDVHLSLVPPPIGSQHHIYQPPYRLLGDLDRLQTKPLDGNMPHDTINLGSVKWSIELNRYVSSTELCRTLYATILLPSRTATRLYCSWTDATGQIFETLSLTVNQHLGNQTMAIRSGLAAFWCSTLSLISGGVDNWHVVVLCTGALDHSEIMSLCTVANACLKKGINTDICQGCDACELKEIGKKPGIIDVTVCTFRALTGSTLSTESMQQAVLRKHSSTGDGGAGTGGAPGSGVKGQGTRDSTNLNSAEKLGVGGRDTSSSSLKAPPSGVAAVSGATGAAGTEENPEDVVDGGYLRTCLRIPRSRILLFPQGLYDSDQVSFTSAGPGEKSTSGTAPAAPATTAADGTAGVGTEVKQEGNADGGAASIVANPKVPIEPKFLCSAVLTCTDQTISASLSGGDSGGQTTGTGDGKEPNSASATEQAPADMGSSDAPTLAQSTQARGTGVNEVLSKTRSPTTTACVDLKVDLIDRFTSHEGVNGIEVHNEVCCAFSGSATALMQHIASQLDALSWLQCDMSTGVRTTNLPYHMIWMMLLLGERMD
eukprot:Clim_evm55s251 gene=Clim_evmTU55s251